VAGAAVVGLEVLADGVYSHSSEPSLRKRLSGVPNPIFLAFLKLLPLINTVSRLLPEENVVVT